MSFANVVEDLVYDKGLDKGKVLDIVSQGIIDAYKARWPRQDFKVVISKNAPMGFEISSKKHIVAIVEDPSLEITAKKAKIYSPSAEDGADVYVPFDVPLGRVDILVAKSSISDAIKRLEQDYIYQCFKNRVGDLITGSLHKQELSGYTVNLGEATAFLPKSCTPDLDFKSGAPIKATIREVVQYTSKGYQIILDRSSANYVVKLFEMEIPELSERQITGGFAIEILKAERISGYKTKLLVKSNSKNIDPVGSCVGVAGSRIKPILADLGRERIDLIPWCEDKEMLLKRCLKPGDVHRVVFSQDGSFVNIWVSSEDKALIIGKNGGNINLASRILEIGIKVHQDEMSLELGSE